MLGVSSFGYLYYYFVDRRFEYKSLNKEDDVEELLLTPIEEELATEKILYSAQDGSKGLSRRKRLIFILLMTSFNFFFAGVEGSFKNFIPAFASSCSLHLSRQEGSHLSGVFFGTYTINRYLVPQHYSTTEPQNHRTTVPQNRKTTVPQACIMI